MIQLTTSGDTDTHKADVAIMRLQEIASTMNDREIILAYSGGKDSDVVLHLAKLAGIRFEAHYHNTTADAPETVHYVKREHPEVIIDRPRTTMWKLIVKNRTPPRRMMRYCCVELKEFVHPDGLLIDGVRASESRQRAGRRMVEVCHKHPETTLFHPIIDWSDADVWGYIWRNRIPYNPLYDTGLKRIGCVMCPMGGKRLMKIHEQLWPKIAQAYKRACERAFLLGPVKGKESEWDWQSGEDMYNRWISQAGRRNDGIQGCFIYDAESEPSDE